MTGGKGTSFGWMKRGVQKQNDERAIELEQEGSDRGYNICIYLTYLWGKEIQKESNVNSVSI